MKRILTLQNFDKWILNEQMRATHKNTMNPLEMLIYRHKNNPNLHYSCFFLGGFEFVLVVVYDGLASSYLV
jgi:hypothetical protein